MKLAKGGIRDIEFLVQCLQRLHGGREPWVRHGGTLLALSRLRDKELLSSCGVFAPRQRPISSCGIWSTACSSTEDRQTHTLPRGIEQLDLLARKMPPVCPATRAPARSSANWTGTFQRAGSV